MAAAEQAHAVDAASRPQDPSFFESWERHERLPDLWVAAQLMGKLGGSRFSAIPHTSEMTLRDSPTFVNNVNYLIACNIKGDTRNI